MNFVINDIDAKSPAGIDYVALEDIAAEAGALKLDLGSDTDLADVAPLIARTTHMRIAFPSFADGRGFTLAKRLRDLGYTGHLRAFGHVIPDQYGMAREAGFDDVEIDATLAARAAAEDYQARGSDLAHSYQSRLRG